MKYIVYLTTNLKSKINGLNRIYIGVHSTENPEIFDGYVGCGVKIQHPSTYKYPKTPFQFAVKKYGVDSFKRATLFIFDTAKEAYNKEHELVNEDFIKQSHVYNVAIGGIYEERFKPLYQFDFSGKLIKTWEISQECYEFYGYPRYRWDSPKRNKCAFLGFYWSASPEINVTEYSNKNITNRIYLYNIDGKLINEFDSQAECARYLKYDTGELSRAIKHQSLIKKSYYVSNKMVDEFKPTVRKNYIDLDYYVYKASGELVSKVHGKELMNLINLHSWDYVNHIFKHNNNWYKDFYISLCEISKIPSRRFGNGISIDVYDKFGNFIEHIDSIKETREKYKIPASKIKNIQTGDRYYGDYIFKYSK